MKEKELIKENMGNLMDFLLTYASKVNWNKVEKVYGYTEVKRLRTERGVMGIDCRISRTIP